MTSRPDHILLWYLFQVWYWHNLVWYLLGKNNNEYEVSDKIWEYIEFKDKHKKQQIDCKSINEIKLKSYNHRLDNLNKK